MRVSLTQPASVETNERTLEYFWQTLGGSGQAWDWKRMGAESGRPTVHPAQEIETPVTVIGGTRMQVTGCASSEEVYTVGIGILLTSDQ